MSQYEYATLKREVGRLKNELAEFQAMLEVAEQWVSSTYKIHDVHWNRYQKEKKEAYMKLRRARMKGAIGEVNETHD
jgi:hypothetical protein